HRQGRRPQPRPFPVTNARGRRGLRGGRTPALVQHVFAGAGGGHGTADPGGAAFGPSAAGDAGPAGAPAWLDHGAAATPPVTRSETQPANVRGECAGFALPDTSAGIRPAGAVARATGPPGRRPRRCRGSDAGSGPSCGNGVLRVAVISPV